MANVGVGFRGFFGLGEETNYGVAASRSHWTEINSESIAIEEDRIETNQLYRRGVINTRVEKGGKRVSGDLEFDATYGGWLKMPKHAFGQVATSTPDITSNPTVKRHKFTIEDKLPTGLTLEVNRDTNDFVTEPNKSFLYTGCKIASMGFACSVNEILRVSANIVGQDEGRVAKGTPAFTSEKLAVYHQGTVQWGNDFLDVESISVTLNNNIEGRPRLGARTIREPLPSDKVEVTGSMSLEFDTWSQYDDFRNATERALVVLFTGSVIAGSFSRYIKLSMPSVIISASRPALSAVGRIMADIDFKAYRTATQQELELEIQNTDTGI